jgi:hypothetical protein
MVEEQMKGKVKEEVRDILLLGAGKRITSLLGPRLRSLLLIRAVWK